jgi:hypothetical protein
MQLPKLSKMAETNTLETWGLAVSLQLHKKRILQPWDNLTRWKFELCDWGLNACG